MDAGQQVDLVRGSGPAQDLHRGLADPGPGHHRDDHQGPVAAPAEGGQPAAEHRVVEVGDVQVVTQQRVDDQGRQSGVPRAPGLGGRAYTSAAEKATSRE
jgi:hypothetical protein